MQQRPQSAVVALSFAGLFLLVATSLLLLSQASEADSVVGDETVHIAAGYGYVRHFDARLNAEHPPLAKVAAGLPLLLLQPAFPNSSRAWNEEADGEVNAARIFLFESGNDSEQIVRVARAGAIILALFAILAVYLTARPLLGPGWSLLPAALFALSPTVLAHGHLVTTDVAAVLGFLVAIHYFHRFLQDPSWKAAGKSGFAFGFAQLCKFSCLLLVPYFAGIVVLWAALQGGIRGMRKPLFFHGSRTLVAIVIGFVAVVYPIYGLITWNYPVQKQVSDTRTLLSTPCGANRPSALCRLDALLRDMNVRLAGHTWTRPVARYMLGQQQVARVVAGATRPTYFMGQVYSGGRKAYFPAVYLMKETIPVLLLLAVGFVVLLR